QVRKAAFNATLGSYSGVVSNQNVLTKAYTATAGNTYCFHSRARDIPGEVSAYSSDKCTTVPFKAAGLSNSSGGLAWSHSSHGSVYGGVVYSAKAKNAYFSKGTAKARHIYIVVSKCSTCGTIQIRWNNTVKSTIALTAPSWKRKQIITITLPSTQSG